MKTFFFFLSVVVLFLLWVMMYPKQKTEQLNAANYVPKTIKDEYGIRAEFVTNSNNNSSNLPDWNNYSDCDEIIIFLPNGGAIFLNCEEIRTAPEEIDYSRTIQFGNVAKKIMYSSNKTKFFFRNGNENIPISREKAFSIASQNVEADRYQPIFESRLSKYINL